MDVLKYLNPFRAVTDIVAEVVEDKDKANKINRKLMEVAEATYRAELATKTVPWVDALHKMGRQLQGYLGYALAFYLAHKGADPLTIIAAVSPSGIYAAMKNRK